MSVVAAAIVGGAVTGAYSARKAAQSQDKATQAAQEAAAASDAISRERLEFDKGQFDWNKDIYERDVAPAQRRNQKLQEEIAGEGLSASRQQRDFSSRQRQEYEDTFLPNERRVVGDASSYDSDGNVSRRSGMAAANVNQQFSNANAQKARLLTRFGLNPNSSAFAREAGKSATAQAAASAGAQTGAAFDTMDRAIALRAGASNLGRNLPNTAAQFGTLGNSSASVAGGASSAAGGALNGGIGMMNNAFDGMSGAFGARGGSILATGQINSNALAQQGNMWANVSQGLGNMAGNLFQRSGGFGGVGNFGFGVGSNSAAAATPLGAQRDGFSTNPQYGG